MSRKRTSAQGAGMKPPGPGDPGPREEQPAFNLDELSWGDQQRVLQLLAGNATLTTANALDMEHELQALWARCTVSVPRSWVVSSAPENLDWSKPEAFLHVRLTKIGALTNALYEAMGLAVSNAKN